MSRRIIMLSTLLLLCALKPAWADSFNDCVQECVSAQTQCVEGITLYAETGVREAKEACASEFTECKGRCPSEDAKEAEEAPQEAVRKEAEDAKEAEDTRQEAVRKEAEEAEKRRQEQQQETLNGSIKILDLNK